MAAWLSHLCSSSSLFSQALSGSPELIESIPKPVTGPSIGYRADVTGEVEGTFSETFPSHDAAKAAAKRAAGEQRVSGDTHGIVYEDANGQWREELADGRDRPWTEVEG